jgi:hypothetical protein
VSDDFSRTVTSGLGIAPTGGAYTVTGTSSAYAVTGSNATITTPAGSSRGALLAGISAADVAATLSVSPGSIPQGGSVWSYLAFRRQSSGAEYRAKVRVDSDGSVAVGLSRVVNGSEQNLAPELKIGGLTVAPGQWLQVRAEAFGTSPTSLRMRAWTGSNEPSTWQFTASDATAGLQAGGSNGVRTYVSATVTNGPMVLSLDDYAVSPWSAPPPPTPSPPPDSVVLAGAGDIAECGSNGSFATAALLASMTGMVFTAGDNAYPDGAAADFACYDQSWGQFNSRVLPVPGNHEYNTAGATGYFGYFGTRAGPPGLGYYATEVGSWRVYSLNSECGPAPMVDCAAEAEWLQADLAANPHSCIAAIWHEPRFNSGDHGDNTGMDPFWQALYNAGAELVVNGHAHDYERFAPMDPQGNVDNATGIREIIAGTGGIGESTSYTPHANSLVFDASTFGVLKLTLRANGYDWQFIPTAGETFTDSGSGTCH